VTKTEIITRLGESAVLLPQLIVEALAANDRLKLGLSALQSAARAAGGDRRGAELGNPELQALAAAAEPVGASRVYAPGLAALVERLGDDLAVMVRPLESAGAADRQAFAERVEAVRRALPGVENDTLERAAIGSLTTVSPETDSLHRLVMDLHRAINRLAAETAPETVEGARTHNLDDWDRARVRAFMAGLNRTAMLAFGHPGLGTTGARSGGRLVIQNDIGETEAHVLVVHVEGLRLEVTYTDVHRRRAVFFISLFGSRLTWTPLGEKAAEGVGEEAAFYLVTGRTEAPDEAALDDLLRLLGSRVVFLIDWNKARKALQALVGRDIAISLLTWAAEHEVGHRAFLELGGAELAFEAVRRAAPAQVPYGKRLEDALGPCDAEGFLRCVLRETSEGLKDGRSLRLIRDEIQADLGRRFETAERAVLMLIVRHLGLSRTLAAAVIDVLETCGSDERQARAWLAERAKRMEAKADALTLQARDACARLQRSETMRILVDEAENAMDELDECAFMISLAPSAALFSHEPLERLAEVVTNGLGELIRAVEAASLLPEGQQADAATALRAIDAVTEAERAADLAERETIAAFMSSHQGDARKLVLGLEIARALEASTDHLAHAAFALRDRVLEELSG
jgi:hypothetical protein